MGMKLSVSLPVDDVEFLDAYASDRLLPSRSAALQEAVGALRTASLPAAYAEAWDDTENDVAAWDATAGDGLP